ncbi:hypothetical protein [Filimonas effusa]|uniref:Ferritin-like domain-containing protein n=1 Tax=Filimonas effusa TaxID=2508721 RepID=A0A4Q1DAE6_9BACT|nr:hypothetical protein [Filimonas effusa]RXK86210.1 hypothetical protein ESB13_05225 [Filimonas effusa]
MQDLLSKIVGDDELHARWLNTLSFMENAGARKISACEATEEVSLMQLKHAAEEHRHAYYLKKQISKLSDQLCATYRPQELLAAYATRRYLHRLDVQVCRYLKQRLGLSGQLLKDAAYLLVTYAIEVRADALYPEYQQVLSEAGHKVTVKSIILEEEGHLEEMLAQLRLFSDIWEQHASIAQQLEQALFTEWWLAVTQETEHPSYA